MAEEEVRAELEALEAVYGDDFHVVDAYPPHIHVYLKPRTANVSSLQFVEATIAIQAGPQYPEEPPDISIIDSKGLDDRRQRLLLTSIREKSFELASYLMFVALCEEAVERLSSMNHPDGDCPLCLYPLVDEDAESNSQPFMKLMSCFHCFHCDCIIRWWNWIQMGSEEEVSNSLTTSISRKIVQDQQGMQKLMEGSMGKCPVCRKVFLAKDIEHVLDLIGTGTHLDTNLTEIDGDLLQTDSEKCRREKFEAILKLQQENNGLIEPKKNEVLLPGMFLPQSVALPSTESVMRTTESQNEEPRDKSGPNSSSSLNRPGSRKHNVSSMRKHRSQNSRKQSRNWVRKQNGSEQH